MEPTPWKQILAWPCWLAARKLFHPQPTQTPGNDPKQGWAAAVLSKDGNVFAAGDFTFLTPPYNTVGDNSTFINNIADFLLGGQRKYVLADFPYIFNGTTVSVLPTSNVQMTAEINGLPFQVAGRPGGNKYGTNSRKGRTG